MQHYPHQNSNGVLHIKKKRKFPKFCIEEQKIQIAEAIMRKKATLSDFIIINYNIIINILYNII